jgi:hypothetical protein
MATVIKIKNTDQNKLPLDGSSNPVIATGELAYSSFTTSSQSNNGGRLYIGIGDDSSTGFAPNYQVIGGEYFTTMLDHVHGTLTASSAVIVDSNSKVDVWNVDNLVMNGNTLSINQTSNANGNLTIAPGGTGELVVTGNATVNGTFDVVGATTLTGNAQITGTLDVDGQSTLASVNIEDLTNNRIVIAGTSGELEDDANFTFDGTTFKVGTSGTDKFRVTAGSGNVITAGALEVDGAVDFNSTLDVDGEATLASAIIEDLTATRVVFSGTGGALVDASTMTFNAGTNTLAIAGAAEVDNVKLDGNTISTLTGTLTLQPNANAETIISSTSALRLPAGNSSERPSTAVTGQVRYNSTTTQFEGYSSGAWQGLGGVIDTDQNTYIIAQPTSNLSVPASQQADTLYFVTGGAYQGKIDTASGWTLNNVNIDDNTIATTSGDLYLDPGNTGSGSPTGNVVVYGNLSVMGDTTTVNSNTITVDDPVFTLGGDTAPSADDNKDRGIEFRWHDGSAAKTGFFGYDDSASRFKFIADATNTSEVFSGDAGDVEFGNAILDGFTLSTGNFGGGNSVPFFNTSGVMGFLVDDATSAYGTEGQVLQVNSSGTPFFGHIDCGTY